MIQLRLISGPEAGKTFLISRYPCVLGRSAKADLHLEAPGIWDKHLRIELLPQDGFVLTVLPDARVAVNSEPVERCALKNGDQIEAGSIKLQFSLAQTRQRSTQWREWMIWIGLCLLSAGQVALIYALAR